MSLRAVAAPAADVAEPLAEPVVIELPEAGGEPDPERYRYTVRRRIAQRESRQSSGAA